MAVVSQYAMRRHPGGALDPSTPIGSPYYNVAIVPMHQVILIEME